MGMQQIHFQASMQKRRFTPPNCNTLRLELSVKPEATYILRKSLDGRYSNRSAGFAVSLGIAYGLADTHIAFAEAMGGL